MVYNVLIAYRVQIKELWTMGTGLESMSDKAHLALKGEMEGKGGESAVLEMTSRVPNPSGIITLTGGEILGRRRPFPTL